MSTASATSADRLTEAALVDTIRRLVECESPSSDDAAVARSADLVAEIGRALLRAEPERIVVDGCSHLRWHFGPETRVLLLAHHDTVWPAGTLARLPFGVDGGVLRGPGAFDMKAGLAMAFHALAALDDRDGVTLLVTGDEEIGSARSRELIESTARGAAAVLVLEASADGGALKAARKGAAMYDVEIDGRAAHAGLEPESGVNATAALAELVLAALALADAETGTSVTPTTAASGTTGNTVPARAHLHIDARSWSAGELARVDSALRAYRSPVDGARLTIGGGINRPPLERAMSRDLLALAERLADGLGLAPVTAVEVGGGSDGNFTGALGIPTLDGLGAVGGGAHADDEHVVVAELLPRTRLLTALVTELIGSEGSWLG
ncbi:M20/M25/M40 family metallo-hydrolase [uncultured Microbacterium sp.]|uniref:M20/M25/M40 family metallo-hydrolase n=1 Tax=uncultured Microbacterium sp. TaxID=191216 RepID=UPI0028DB36D2|nr:M20/M25/M40 family metallo-hydrolase [uncultured Microbacterium sp.]